MSLVEQVKKATPDIISKYSERSDAKALLQFANTLIPYFALFYLAMSSMQTSYALTAVYVALLSLFIVRIFMLMHDCGHNSMFHTPVLNNIGGFFTGVFVGMPQYVWSQHHNYHHSTNGNWEKYRGPLNILSVSEYENLSPARQKLYRYSRNIALAPLGAFMYFIFNPRFNWMVGSVKFVMNIIGQKFKNPKTPFKSLVANYETRLWKSGREYWHMTMNNIVLLGIWAMASWYFGAAVFFTIYLVSLSLAGAAGIIIFTIQHNFEDSYASEDKGWDYHLAAIKGTSFLTFPKVINWFGADIAYHHVHHLSARIPNYNLARCHRDHVQLFDDVMRIRMRDIAKAFRFILWDTKGQKIISVAQYDAMKAAA